MKAGFRALAIDFRGYGQSRGPRSKSEYDGAEYDVLAAVGYLHKTGAKTVSVIGESFGGAAADASMEAAPGEIDRLVLLAARTDRSPEKMKGRKLFIVARDDANDDGPRPLGQTALHAATAEQHRDASLDAGSKALTFLESGTLLIRFALGSFLPTTLRDTNHFDAVLLARLHIRLTDGCGAITELRQKTVAYLPWDR